MVEKYSIKLFKPHWPTWRIWFVDQLLMLLPLLKVRKANQILRDLKEYQGSLFIELLAHKLQIKTRVKDIHHIPKEGPVIIVCNHPGKADVIAMLNVLTELFRREDTVILANKFICVKNVHMHVIPVDTLAPKGKKVSMEQVENALHQGKIVVIFPYGLDSRYDAEGELRDLEWKPTFIDLAKKYDVPLIISHIGGTQNSQLFHNVAAFRKRISWLKNIPLELAFLLRELVYAKSDVTITFTQSIPPTFLHEHARNNVERKMMAEIMREYCYRIPELKGKSKSFIQDHFYL